MLSRNLLPVLLGIILLSGMFLGGQATWERKIPCELVQDCDDMNPCADEACEDSTCVYTNNTDPCTETSMCTRVRLNFAMA